VQTIHGHEGACAAAASVRMGRDRGKADAMISWLFDNQSRIVELGIRGGPAAVDAVKQGAQQVLGVTDFEAEYAKKLPEIRKDVADGGALGVPSTPTFYINGVHAADGNGNFLPAQYFDLALKLEIAKGTSK
jgi:protein-disulfide isomerase